jgi:dTDP-4-amino-4,6-dideoxygalactose transaminase
LYHSTNQAFAGHAMTSISTPSIHWWQNNLLQYADGILPAIEKQCVSMGEVTELFENLIARFVGSRHCVCFPSGTAAITGALISTASDSPQVLMPNRTWIGTANAASFVTNSIYLVDSSEEHQNMDPSSLESALRSVSTINQPTIIYVPINGSFYRHKDILRLASKYSANLIVDACQAFGSNLSAAHSFLSSGHHLCFSFGMPKLVSTGLGGCVVTESTAVDKSLREIRNQGLSSTTPASQISYANCKGFNFKFTDLQSSLGVSQMMDIESIIGRHRSSLSIYSSRLDSSYDITRNTLIQDELPLRAEILLPEPCSLAKFLSSKGIETSARTDNIDNHPHYRHLCQSGSLTHSAKFSGTLLVLPSGPMQPADSINRVCDAIDNFNNR